MSLKTEAMVAIKNEISTRLAEIAALLPNVYRLTFVARHRGKEDGSANIVVSDDNLDAAIEAIRIMQRDDSAWVSGPEEPAP